MPTEPQWPSVETIRQILDSRQEEIDPCETVEVMFGASGKDPDDFGYQWGSPDFMGAAYHYAWQVTTSIDAKSDCQAVAEWVVDQWNEYDIQPAADETVLTEPPASDDTPAVRQPHFWYRTEYGGWQFVCDNFNLPSADETQRNPNGE
jgi:hypothetical protein